MADTGRELADLASELVTYPQVLVNVRVRERKDLSTVPQVADAMKRVEQRLSGSGRLLVRYSGTEPLLRIMIEGQDQQRDPGLGRRDRAEVVETRLRTIGIGLHVRLAVNIDHIATIRQARKAREPDPLAAALIAERAGAEGITVHLRTDRRHIQDRDLEVLRHGIGTKLNVEMAVTDEMARHRAEGPARPGDARTGAPAGADDRGRAGRRAERRGGEAVHGKNARRRHRGEHLSRR